jgi:hypothetical protein
VAGDELQQFLQPTEEFRSVDVLISHSGVSCKDTRGANRHRGHRLLENY